MIQLRLVFASATLIIIAAACARNSLSTDWPRLNGTMPTFDTTKTVTVAEGPGQLYRTDARIRFEAGVSDSTKAAFFVRRRLEVLGLDPTGIFYVRFADPGPTIEDFYRFLASLEAEPETLRVMSIVRGGLAESPGLQRSR